MPTTIENFMNVASQKQFSRDFLFRVKQVDITGLRLDGDNELIYARSASFPGRDIENKQVNYAGQTFNLPGKSSYPGSESWQIEFYADQNMDIRSQLERASRTLFNNEGPAGGNICMPGNESTITLEVYKIPCNSVLGNPMQLGTIIQLVGASLRNIGEIGYEIADGTGEVKTFPATFAFHFYRYFTSNEFNGVFNSL
jgi:hypothetical protein